MATNDNVVSFRPSDYERQLLERAVEQGDLGDRTEVVRYCVRIALGEDPVITPSLRRKIEAFATILEKTPEEVSELFRAFVEHEIERLKS